VVDMPSQQFLRDAQSSAGIREAVRAQRGAVPVVAAKVEQKDVPIYLDGLGTVRRSTP